MWEEFANGDQTIAHKYFDPLVVTAITLHIYLLLGFHNASDLMYIWEKHIGLPLSEVCQRVTAGSLHIFGPQNMCKVRYKMKQISHSVWSKIFRETS